ncbi:MAG: carboxypeptidase regulatory-like domain-containing protein, partial [Acidimicrobiia bacterium]
MQRKPYLLLGSFLSAFLVLSGAAPAQTTSASIEGTITDQTGGRMPGVTVMVTNTDTGLSRTVVTDGRGFYRVPSLDVGRYSVKAELNSFSAAVQNEVTLQINQTGVVDFTLQPSTLQETVTVTAAPVQVNTVTSAIGHIIDNKRIVDLPLNGRSFDQLISLVPGAIDSGGLRGYSVNGARPGANTFLLNGTDANNNYFPENVSGRNGISFTSLGISSIENIQE